MVRKHKRYISISKIFGLIAVVVLCNDLFQSSCRAEELKEQGAGADAPTLTDKPADQTQQKDSGNVTFQQQPQLKNVQSNYLDMQDEGGGKDEWVDQGESTYDSDAKFGWRQPIRINPEKVHDDSLNGGYKSMWNRATFQAKSDNEAYSEFLKEEEREKKIMQSKDEWIAAQSAIKKSYFSNLQDDKFDAFLINGFIGVMVTFVIIVILCFVFRKCCTSSLIGANKDMEELDREAYDDLKKEYMERRRAKIAEQRQAQYKTDAVTEPSSGTIKAKKQKEVEMKQTKLK